MNIPISRTELHEDDIRIIEEPLKSGWVVQGNFFVKKFEDQFSESYRR